MKTLTAAAAALLLSTSAFAQQMEGASPAAGAMPSSTSANANAGNFQTNQGQDQWLVSNLWGKSVYNKGGQSIGDLNDILINKDGKVAAIVVGVGGFLGLGEKNVAVNFDHLKQNGNIAPDRIVLGMSEQDLRNAPAFVRSSNSGSSSR